MHDDTHLIATDSEYCVTCGQPIKPAPSYGARNGSNRIGIAISILLHVVIVLYYLLRSEPERRAPPPAKEQSAMVYVAPLKDQLRAKTKPDTPPKQAKQPKQPKAAKAAKPPSPSRQKPVLAITPPARPKQETIVPPVVAPVPTPVQEVDMEARIAARRKQRGEPPAPEAVESDNDRAMRVARANIAGAQSKNSGDDKNDSGGVFSIVNQTSHSADIKFRGWNTNFKRRWLSQVTVEQGAELDIETAIVKKMIELIRKEKPGDFVWESHRLGRNVPMSARPEDAAELQAFLLKEFFPEYRARR